MNKEDFPVFQEYKELIYLDNSATTQKPQQVIQAMVDFYTKSNANVHRGIHFLSQKATLDYEKAHGVIAGFIGADSEEVIFTSGTTASLNMAAQMLASVLQEGDEILLTEMEHHSNIVPWQQLARQKKCHLKYIPVTSDYRLDLKKARELFSERTKIVAVTQMSNVLGTINPVKDLVKMAHAVGAYVVVDAAQSVPHMKVNVKELGCDFLAFSGHKMCGPTGIGVLYGKKELLMRFEPTLFGGGMIQTVDWNTASWADFPVKFEAGTPHIAGAFGLMKAARYLQQIGLENVENHTSELTSYALEKLSLIPNLSIIGPTNVEQRGAVISFTIKEMHPHDIADYLDKHDIAVRAGHHCAMPLMKKLSLQGTVRASFYLYNTKKEIDLLVEALQELGAGSAEDSQAIIDPNQIVFGELSEEQELYRENVIDHYKEPRNKRIIERFTHTYTAHNPLCGDHLTVYFKEEDKTVADISFTGDGCAISQAAMSLLTEHLQGRNLGEVFTLSEKGIFNLLGIPISPARYRCALLSLKTIQGALHNELRN